MNDGDPLFPRLPSPVLSYEMAGPPRYLWIARFICGLAMMNGLVSAGYIMAYHLPGSTFMHAWTDVPTGVCGLTVAVFGAMGIFRVPGSRLGTVICAIASLPVSWAGQLVYMRINGPPDLSTIAYALVGIIDNALIPSFVALCLMTEPIKRCFAVQKPSD